MNLPNQITLARIALVPVMMLFLLVNFSFGERILHIGSTFAVNVNDVIAAVIFIIAAATDGIDGHIARSRNLVTNLGKLLDPLADKLLVSAALISLVSLGKCAAWMAIIIIFREFAITGLRQIALLEGAVVAASNWGKAKTITQIIAIVLLMINNFPFALVGFPLAEIAIWAATIITLYSGVDYFVKNKHLLHLSNS
ncbi:CDP-diacylglycerol--glycerol-3-phosphate 3-phosphatidyltransferase [Paenibacillus hunanensis]|uniref:CDP-diacylglycerol--glycerol-3-phosphate 3-phosphatidyltransferase n=1 Tax=Paenibacillus hunanensis TaxID=539262 RepID=A0ABU1IZH6_9BACL|nr:CDP-diacylglycerol--glycerol-3-phosphate 3-phosphatidyltransferase [Paenibacillus hunanensis]MCL9660129.1 CDP-diacylglycerol--glycerol-3-phosphate 3-phosphatidyltransferase [Paenibacillus hunanensis]MDR6244648.1 CDP-diacylglycerol--glycerol-3-phosphate 3-phosphatidyltransferase [Paenibacillus hunanensis]WPP39776.1 CDP-diacylglycerol--glycerol-3-phosphate 3-phosphatidyltransferase [Paenibacillus hunanensis]GGJ22655.1 CDP-diacylglycerol--glycerol-3-phosphate 3-phosphatidyltransferase [Paenibac